MTPLMRSILEVLAEDPDATLSPNTIGYRIGVAPVSGGRGQGGRGRGHRVFGPAQRIIFPLNRLRELGLIDFAPREDGKSGTAYYITTAGKDALRV